jgi:hypothetical protein
MKSYQLSAVSFQPRHSLTRPRPVLRAATVCHNSSYTISQSIGGTGVSPVHAQAKACGYHKLLFGIKTAKGGCSVFSCFVVYAWK